MNINLLVLILSIYLTLNNYIHFYLKILAKSTHLLNEKLKNLEIIMLFKLNLNNFLVLKFHKNKFRIIFLIIIEIFKIYYIYSKIFFVVYVEEILMIVVINKY